MFTGIVTGIGHIVETSALGDDKSHGLRLTIQVPTGYLDDVEMGDSIALNGACMTVASFHVSSGRFTVDISAESLSKTSGLDGLGPVNLEKALRADQRLGGHLVSGHVDGIGTVIRFDAVGESWQLNIQAPLPLARFLAYKGSVAINGVSLTVNEVVDNADGCEFSINLIPHTVQATTLHQLAVKDHVNLEIDPIARYVERLLTSTAYQR